MASRRSHFKTALDFSHRGIRIRLAMNLRRRHGRWYVRFSLDGKQWERSTGESDRDKALCKISEIVKQAAHEIEQGVTQSVTTFAELVAEYRPFAKVNKAASSYEREASTTRVLMRVFADAKLAKITRLDIELYMQKRLEKVKPSSVNRELALLRHMLNKAVDWGYLKTNPAARVKPFKEPPGRVRYLSDGERERLLDACKDSENAMLYPVVFTALNTGMRKGELQRLTWDDVDFDERIITVRQTKNNEIRHIPVNSVLLPVLEDLSRANPHAHYVFSRPDGTAYGNWRKSFDNACRNAGIKDFRFHDLRHTFASYLGMSGCNAFEIKALTGHKTLSMAARYTHISSECLRLAVDKIRARLGHKLGQPV
jgi:integrase